MQHLAEIAAQSAAPRLKEVHAVILPATGRPTHRIGAGAVDKAVDPLARLGLQVLEDGAITRVVELLVAHEDLCMGMVFVENAGVVLAEMDQRATVRGGSL